VVSKMGNNRMILFSLLRLMTVDLVLKSQTEILKF